MASKEINLVAFEKKLTPAEQEGRKRLKKTVIVVLAVYALLSGSVLGYFFHLNQKLHTIEASVSYEQEQIRAMAKNEGIYMVLKQKSMALSEIIPLKADVVALFTFLKSQESDSISLSEMTFTEAGQVSFQARLKDTATLDAFLNAFIGEKGKLLRRVELSGVNFNADGTFQITFTLQAA